MGRQLLRFKESHSLAMTGSGLFDPSFVGVTTKSRETFLTFKNRRVVLCLLTVTEIDLFVRLFARRQIACGSEAVSPVLRLVVGVCSGDETALMARQLLGPEDVHYKVCDLDSIPGSGRGPTFGLVESPEVSEVFWREASTWHSWDAEARGKTCEAFFFSECCFVGVFQADIRSSVRRRSAK
ncbi:hypothetical protein QR680_013295 [Steinernema hermaphroditum]|uniref:Uncharacterized protein n=1 Tax=Steinernema hermaphroditum TaxID=289476 RepID=A0AA39I511_9BILA|nr:hypothetical protein QR680_013295 [Steinernema hermaphroditum]